PFPMRGRAPDLRPFHTTVPLRGDPAHPTITPSPGPHAIPPARQSSRPATVFVDGTGKVGVAFAKFGYVARPNTFPQSDRPAPTQRTQTARRVDRTSPLTTRRRTGASPTEVGNE